MSNLLLTRSTSYDLFALQRALRITKPEIKKTDVCVASPGEAELQGLLQVLPQAVLRILLLGIVSCRHAATNRLQRRLQQNGINAYIRVG